MRTINLYKFDELNEQAKKVALNNFHDYLYNNSDFWDCVNDDIKEQFALVIKDKFAGIWIDNIYYSLSNCQGDGVSFTGTIDNTYNRDGLYDFFKQVYSDNIPHKIKRVIPFIDQINFERGSSRYYHKYTVWTNVIDGYDTYKHKRYLSVLNQIEKDIENYRLNICDELEKMGYQIQDGYFDDDYKIELLTNPDGFCAHIEFLETGKIFKE
jgi:hypothetical protein